MRISLSFRFPILLLSLCFNEMTITRQTHTHISLPVTFFKLRRLNHALTWFLLNLFLLIELPTFGTAQSGGMAPPPDLYPFKQTISKRMAAILIVLVCFFIILAVVSFYCRQCSDQSFGGRLVLPAGQDGSNNRSRRSKRGLDASVIATFPTFVYSNVKGLKIGKGSLECAICLCEFEDDETLRLLPQCNHVFHSNCIDAWLVSHSTCPVCRASLVPKPGDMSFAALLNSDSGIDVDGRDNRTHLHGSDNGQVVVQIAEENQAPDASLISPINQSRPIRSRSAGWRLTGIFPRSHSTGHSLVQRGDNYERFTLRLPEEVRSELLNSNLNRARSCVALPRMQSSRQGYRGGTGNEHGKSIVISSRSGRSDWRTFFPMTPFFRKEGSRRIQRDDVNGDVDGLDRPFARLRPHTDGQSQS